MDDVDGRENAMVVGGGGDDRNEGIEAGTEGATVEEDSATVARGAGSEGEGIA